MPAFLIYGPALYKTPEENPEDLRVLSAKSARPAISSPAGSRFELFL
jgi:hypothetical protein